MKLKIGIVGATGLVGKELLSILSEKLFNICELRLFSSENSANTSVRFNDTEITVKPIYSNCFNQLDYVFFCSNNLISETYIPIAVQSGAVVIDNSSHFRMINEVPLIIPEINWSSNFQNKKLFANPNCSTIIALTALYPLHKFFKLNGFHATTFQAASGYGRDALDALTAQNLEKQKAIFGAQLTLNAIPKIGKCDELGATEEENKMVYESRKILHDNELKISATCVRIPVERAHSMSIIARFDESIDINLAKKLLMSYNNVIYCDEFPTPIVASMRDKCLIGRLRKDTFCDNALSMFVSCDQIRKGAALNAVQILEKLISQ